MKLSKEHQELMDRYNNQKAKAIAKPNTLVKLNPGSYFFFSSKENTLLIVEDDSYENGGGADWVAREEGNNNVVNTYYRLRDFRNDWQN